MSPSLSVIIPVYNGGAALDAQLAALEHESTVGGHEVIVADNGSTDDSAARAARWADRIPLRVVDASDRKGAPAARNIAATHARGDAFVFCDADDEVQPGWLAAHGRALHDADLVAGAIVHVVAGEPTHVPSIAPTLLGWWPYAQTANCSVRRSTWATIGGFDESTPPAEDVDFSWRAQLAGALLHYEPSAVLHKHERPTLRARVRQHALYGAADVDLYLRYREHGVPRPSAAALARTYGGLVVRIPGLHDPVMRSKWSAQVGRRYGRIRGSIRRRTFYP